jgi:DDE_Tnp_1-associated
MLILIELLKQVKDWRRSQGKRHPLWWLLLLVILGTMTMLIYRAWARFAQTEGPFMAQALKIKSTQWPEESTIRRAIIRVEADDLLKVFSQWMTQLNLDKKLSGWSIY